MRSFETELREMIVTIVRDEMRRVRDDDRRRDEFLSTRHAAEVADVAEGTIRRWVREGKLENHRAGRVVRVRRADLERLLNAGGPRNDTGLTPEQLADRDFG